jgi:hypothetical protein
VRDTQVKAFVYVGRPLDIDASLYMTSELIRQRGRAFIDYKARGGEDGKAKFFLGYAKGLEARIDDILAKAETSMRAQGKAHLGPRAIKDRQQAWYERTYGRPDEDLPRSAVSDTPYDGKDNCAWHLFDQPDLGAQTMFFGRRPRERDAPRAVGEAPRLLEAAE